jgi:TRAP-type uncharacterized transport system fused permease subunit
LRSGAEIRAGRPRIHPPQRNRRLQWLAARRRSKPGTIAMAAMSPFFLMINSLEGFELACFWLAVFVGFFLIGFVLDYLMGRQGFGPYVNSLLALIGALAGLYARYNYCQGYLRYEPYLSLTLLFAAPVFLIVVLSFLRTRAF